MKEYLYKKIIEDIKNQIKNEDFSYNFPICTEKSLCEKYAVSRITAIKALDELYEKGIIYKKRGVGCFVVKKELNSKSLHLSEDISAQKKVVALIMPFQVPDGGVFYTIQTMNKMLIENNVNLSFFSTEHSEGNEHLLFRKLREENISAIVYYPTAKVPYQEFYYYITKNIPIIIIDTPISTKFIHNICSGNANGQFELTEQLVRKGHRKIAYGYSNINYNATVQDRILGYVNALAKNKIECNEEFITYMPTENKEKLKKTVKDLIKKGVTAIECNNDQTAFSVYLACQSLNIKIPEELSLTGFDNSQWANLMGLSLTTMKQDFEKIGKIVSMILLAEFSGKSLSIKHYTLPTIFVERNSIGIVDITNTD